MMNDKPKWVSVNDDLPYSGDDVVVIYVDEYGVTGPEIDYLEHDSDTGVDYWANHAQDEVTHWCPIADLRELRNE